MRAQMLSELRFCVVEIKRDPTAPGPKEHFQILLHQMTARERAELKTALLEMLDDCKVQS